MKEITVVNVLRGEMTVVESARGPRGLPGASGLAEPAVQALAEAEAQELRIDMDALVAATLSI
jgi:hypothetical protein